MIQAPLQKSIETFKSLKAISGGLNDKTSGISILVNLAWTILYTAFWNGIIFSEEEKRSAMTSIRNILMLKNSPQKGYIEFIQRVLLARYHNNRYPVLNLPFPTQWLNGEYKLGYSSTKDAFKDLCKTRISDPLYKNEMNSFGTAILEIYKEPTGKNFHSWSSYFIFHRQARLYFLFLSTAANCRFPW